MVDNDTIRLLRECDSGVKMSISSINDVLDKIESKTFKKRITECKKEHENLQADIAFLIKDYNDDGKQPNPIAKGMSWMKTNLKLAVEESDQTIAELMTDGCNIGVKCLSQYLNKYKSADEKSKAIAKKLINSESKLSEDIRSYL